MQHSVLYQRVCACGGEALALSGFLLGLIVGRIPWAVPDPGWGLGSGGKAGFGAVRGHVFAGTAAATPGAARKPGV